MKEFEPPKLHQKVIYHAAASSTWLVLKTFYRLEIVGEENVPLSGGVLLAANHISVADPPIMGASSPRVIYFFAKEQLFKVPVFGWMIAQMNAFPVKREEHDIGAFRKAQHLLQNGQGLLLFPEGTRSKNGELGKARPGVGMLAFRTGVPVVPVHISNSNRMGKFKKVRVAFGTPLTPSKEEMEQKNYQSFSDRVLKSIEDLKSKMYNEKLKF